MLVVMIDELAEDRFEMGTMEHQHPVETVLSENSIFVSRSAFVLVNQPTETVVSTDQT